jgi:hypothetical protein
MFPATEVGDRSQQSISSSCLEEHMLVRRLRDLPTRQVVAEDGPHPSVELVIAARLRVASSSPAVPGPAVSIGPQRPPTDNNGRCRFPPGCRVSPPERSEGASQLVVDAREHWALG